MDQVSGARDRRDAAADGGIRAPLDEHARRLVQPNARLLRPTAETAPRASNGLGLGLTPGPGAPPAPPPAPSSTSPSVPIVDVSPVAHPADAMNTPNVSPPHAPVDWDLMASLGLYAERPTTPDRTSPLSPMSDMLTALPSAVSASESTFFPVARSSSLRSSNSIRSQRNWSEFDGHPVSPLPSPMIRSTQEPHGSPRELHSPEMPASPTERLSKTQAFFSPGAHPPPPKPPQNRSATVARSASSRKASSSADSQPRRQRALSSPHHTRTDTLPVPSGASAALAAAAAPSATPPAPHAASSQVERLSPALPIERKASRPTARHFYGPSMTVTNDSIVPSTSPPHAPVPEPTPAPASAPMPEAPSERDAAPEGDHLLDAVDHPTEQEDEQAGRVGPYRVLSRLGTGAFSKVLLAEPLGPPQGRVALKMIACEPWKIDRRMRVSWVREAEVLRHISHPNIVRFVNAFRTPHHYTLVLDAVDGGELFDLLAHHHAAIAEREWLVRRIFGELAGAVGWMHANNLVHRDIKLENIMMTRTLFAAGHPPLTPAALGPIPLVKITDFGLARFIHADQLLETRCGSEEYAAPELIIGKKYDGHKTDAWALGVVLYALLTGGLPFLQSSTPSAAAEAHEQPTRERHHGAASAAEREAKSRKTHLLRIAKGELVWPQHANHLAESAASPNYEPALRLVTPQARHITQRFLRRDAARRAACWELWQDPWFLYGSFAAPQPALAPTPNDDATMLCVALEASAANERVALPYDPQDARGQAWIASCAATHGEAAPLFRDLPP